MLTRRAMERSNVIMIIRILFTFSLINNSVHVAKFGSSQTINRQEATNNKPHFPSEGL